MTERRRYSVESIGNDAAAFFQSHPTVGPHSDPEIYAAKWFAERLLEIIVPRASWKLTDKQAKIRFSPELDSFEFMNHMIPYEELPSVISMMLHALDDAEQARFECPECKQSRGFFPERGFRRCNHCGYPGQ